MCATNDMALRKCVHVSIFTHRLRTGVEDIRNGSYFYWTSIFSVTTSLNCSIHLFKINFLFHMKIFRPVIKRNPSRLYKETDDGSEVRSKRRNTCCGKTERTQMLKSW